MRRDRRGMAWSVWHTEEEGKNTSRELLFGIFRVSFRIHEGLAILPEYASERNREQARGTVHEQEEQYTSERNRENERLRGKLWLHRHRPVT